ncbi:MAG: hypothetical protein WBV82_32110 [Myxococcaceae bacterium]
MRTFISIAAFIVFALGPGCAQAHQKAAVAPSQKLYFAVEVVREGRVVAQPKLLGEAGRRLKAERRAPGAPAPDYQLSLLPVLSGDRYRIDLDLQLPGSTGHSELALLHGEERRLELGRKPGDLAIRLMVMEVDSPEFRALMGLMDGPGVGGAGSI